MITSYFNYNNFKLNENFWKKNLYDKIENEIKLLDKNDIPKLKEEKKILSNEFNRYRRIIFSFNKKIDYKYYIEYIYKSFKIFLKITIILYKISSLNNKEDINLNIYIEDSLNKLITIITSYSNIKEKKIWKLVSYCIYFINNTYSMYNDSNIAVDIVNYDIIKYEPNNNIDDLNLDIFNED